MPNLLKVRVSLKGRPMRTYTFNKKEVSIGRDPSSDIFLDNTGISRAHAKIERTPGGYVVEDLGSANGTFLNDQQVSKDYLGHDDVVRIGKFALWMGVEAERRESGAGMPATPNTYEGTTVLSPEQLMDMQMKSKAEEIAAPEPTVAAAVAPEPSVPAPAKGHPTAALITVGAVCFLFGAILGAAGAFLVVGG